MAASDEQNGWIRRVLGFALDGRAPQQVDLDARVRATAARLKALGAAPQGATDALRAAITALKTGDLAGCAKALDTVDRTIPSRPVPSDVGDSITAWQDAIETVDKQIEELGRVLRSSDDEELQQIAEFGLNAITGGYKTPLMASLLELQGKDAESIVVISANTVKQVTNFRSHIESDDRVTACDGNPFGVTVGIRSVLVPALARLQASLHVG
ncbi:MAG TPA: hypothetical protein VLI93_00475 [Acetobacteraceae bacterium]|nr:hypothetical protein [Acetobacteraceae bacterium]